MKPLSLLPKYLLITAAICAVAIALTGLSLYVAFRSSLDTALSQSALLFQDQMVARIEEHAQSTTRIVAERIGTLARGASQAELDATMRRLASLDGASLMVLFNAAGKITGHSGDQQMLTLFADVGIGEVRVLDSFIVARMPLPGGGNAGSVGQVFDTTMTNADASVLRSLLAALVAKFGRDTIAWAFALTLLVMVGIFSLLVLFARRQVGDIRLLTRGAERMTAGDYDGAIALPRQDELGRLAASFDELRRRLQTTTISRDYLDRVLGSMSEALFIVSQAGVITRINAAASQLLDLPEATRLKDGDGLKLEDGSWIAIEARPEALLEITATDAAHLVRIAWHLGNRHLPTQLLDGKIRIREDHVIAEMVLGLGGTVAKLAAPFDPEAGAYAGGGGHHHHHHDDDDHHHHH